MHNRGMSHRSRLSVIIALALACTSPALALSHWLPAPVVIAVWVLAALGAAIGLAVLMNGSSSSDDEWHAPGAGSEPAVSAARDSTAAGAE